MKTYSYSALQEIPGVTQSILDSFISKAKSGENPYGAGIIQIQNDGRGRTGRCFTEEFRAALVASLTGAPIPEPVYLAPTAPPVTNTLQEKAISLLSDRQSIPLFDLANSLGCSPAQAIAAVTKLQQHGHCVRIDEEEIVVDRNLSQVTQFVAPPWSGGSRHKVGIISDTHYGNKHAKVKSIQASYDYFEQQGCEFVIHGGDIVDGSPAMHKGFEFELMITGLDDQMAYVREHYPTNLPTIFFGGNHDESWLKTAGYSVAWNLCRGHSDWHFGGDIDGFIAGPDGRQSFMYVLHPGGGSAYAYSWKAQKMNEYLSASMSSLTSSIRDHGTGEYPSFTFQGHYHKKCYVPGPNNCHSFLVGASCDTTSFQRKHSIVNHTGALLLDYTLDDNGNVCRHKEEWLDYPYGVEAEYTKRVTRAHPVVNLWKV